MPVKLPVHDDVSEPEHEEVAVGVTVAVGVGEGVLVRDAGETVTV